MKCRNIVYFKTDEQKKSLENWRMSISFSQGGGEWDE